MIPQTTPELDGPEGWTSHPTAEISKRPAWDHVPFNAKGNHNNQQHFGKEEGKGCHDNVVNLEFIGIFNLKKRSEVKIDCLN